MTRTPRALAVLLASVLALAAMPPSALAAGRQLAGSVQPAVGKAAVVSHHGAELPVTLILKRGLSVEQVGAVESYMQAQGFATVLKLARNVGLRFRGSVAQVESTFGTTINDYQRGGRTFYANASPIFVPAAIAPYVAGVLDLDNAVRARPLSSGPRIVAPNGTTTPPYMPQQLRHFYNLDALSVDGSGQKIGIITFAPFSLNDVRTFEKTFGLPQATINVTVAPPLAGAALDTNASGRQETTLDVSWSSAMAPGAEIEVVEAPNGDWVGAFNSMAAYQPNVISVSWGSCDKEVDGGMQDAFGSALDALNLNVPILIASGDDGSLECVADGDQTVSADWPSTDPHVTAVGGTRLNPDAFGNPAYGDLSSEEAWHCGTVAGGCTDPNIKFSSSGGGFSNHFSAPAWQSSIAVTNHSGTVCGTPPCRGVPDVALLADPDTGFQLRYAGQWLPIGGTSAATPALAGLLVTVNQALGSNFTNSGISTSSFNNQLYGLAGGGSSPFHDIGAGFSNESYVTGPGWDAVTGLGSVDARLLYGAIHGTTPPVANPPPAISTGTVDDKSGNIDYEGNWGLCTTTPCPQGLNHTLHITRTLGDTAAIQFSGTAITLIYATNFDGGTGSVTIDGSAPPSNSTIDELSGDTQFHAGQLVTYSGLASGNHILVFTFSAGSTLYLDAFSLLPVVTKLSRHSGPSTPTSAMSVRISGSGFTGATEVDFGQSIVTSFVSHTETLIALNLPAQTSGDPGVIDVVVKSPTGASAVVAADRFSYAPAVTRVTPKAGPGIGSTPVTVFGSNMLGADGVCFGLPSGINLADCPNPASGFVVVSGGLKVTAPGGTGSVPVLVHGPGGWSDSTTAPSYSYVPVAASISPKFGPASGAGPVVTIRGLNLAAVDMVCFGPLSAGSCPTAEQSPNIAPSSTSLAAQPPSGTGVEQVLLHNPAGWSSAVAALTYSYAPILTAVSPARGAAGASVKLTGKNFTNVVEVDFGSAQCTVTSGCATPVSDTSITLTAPASGLPADQNSVSRGAVPVVVKGPGGSSPTSAKLTFGYTG